VKRVGLVAGVCEPLVAAAALLDIKGTLSGVVVPASLAGERVPRPGKKKGSGESGWNIHSDLYHAS
jgi:hypothetical protein